MNKMDEVVYAVPKDKLFEDGLFEFQGLLARSDDHFLFQAIMENIFKYHIEMTRGECENDPGYKHIIPYVVIKTHRGKYLLTTRTENQTERRLHNKKSIGVGGHIGPVTDKAMPKDMSFAEMVDLGMRRELLEELQASQNDDAPAVRPLLDILKPKHVGIINDDSNSVGSVHLGLVYFATIKQQDMQLIGIKETENMTSSWCDFSEMKAMEGLESWSQIIINSGS